MATFQSGRFVRIPTGVGIVLQCSSNHHGDGSTTDFVEVLGPIPTQLLLADEVSDYAAEPEPDGSEVIDADAEDVTGIGE